MPFKKNSAYQLTLAVAAILCAPLVAAQSDERLWVCDLLPNGEWDCEVNELLMDAQSGEPSIPSSPAPRSVTTPEVTSSPANPSKPEVTPVRPEPESRVQAYPSEPSTLTTQTSQPVAATPQQQTSNRARSADAWDCTVGTDGNWSCAPGNNQAVSVAELGRFNSSSPGASGLLLNNPYAYLDWYPYNNDEPALCRGRYVEPDIDYLQKDLAPGEEAVYAEADLSNADLQSGLARLTGGVKLQQESRLFTSRYGEVDNENSTAFLEGEVTFREPGLLLVGQRAETNFDTGVSSFYSAEYIMHTEHLRGSAAKITRYDDNRVRLESGAITYCEPGNSDWAINSGNIVLHPDKGYGIATHATFRVADIPVFYMPWFRFPIDSRRQSGFLYPSLGISKSDGVDFSIPYYFNIAPNLDDTLALRHIEKRGMLLENELRYMNDWSHNTLSLGYLSGDNKYEDEDRWLVGFNHEGSPSERWLSHVDYTKVSDIDYFADLGTSLEVQREDHLNQQGQLRYLGNGWQFLANLHQYQTISGGGVPYQKSPQLQLTGNEQLGSGVALNYLTEFVRFDTSDSSLIHANRVHLRPSLSYRASKPWGYSNAELTLWHSSYDYFNKPAGNAASSLTAGIASIDSGLYFDRDFSIGSKEFSQSLEPRLQLLHSEKNNNTPSTNFDSSQMSFSYYNLFDRYGWSGNDRVSATSQVTLGTSSALYNNQGREVARIAAAQAFYAQDREQNDLRPGDVSGTESSSNIALLAQWSLTPTLRLRHDSEVNRDDFSLEEQNYQLTWRPDDENLFYFSYRDRINSTDPNNERTRQSDLVFRNQLDPQWAVIGRWQHDIANSQRLDTLLGLEYGTCCWKMRFTAREYLSPAKRFTDAADYDRGVFIQVVLRGLGSFGGDGGRSLIEEITGFREKDHDNF
ncbi:LPS assembly protein LptD [Nitrincola iocasae]|uniref:LPS-assembly protein LptD n=1 Tax=Nitrincola iocasae TaxID=2614693 RepID=A0A5J6LFU9_9GAMM|nr:LPS assembly protein LptD [Nitrincola iocasae]QEW07500.1 LPS assembly protein LptD [Nitrincola iocasae]